MKKLLSILGLALLCCTAKAAIFQNTFTTNSTGLTPGLLTSPSITSNVYPLVHVDTDGTIYYKSTFIFLGTNLTFNGSLSLNGRTNLIGDNGTSLTYNGAAIGGTSETNVQNNFYTTNNFFISGKGNTLIMTNYVRFPWTTLAMTGTNVAQIDLNAGSMFRVYLSANAFFGAVANHPGTNLSQTIQIALIQDGTGGRAVTMTNSTWFLSGSGATTNAMPTLNSNINAISVLTFVTHPTNSIALVGVPTTIAP